MGRISKSANAIVMEPTKAATLALIAFGCTELFLRRGRTAKNWKPGRSDRGTTILIVASYLTIVLLLSLPKLQHSTFPLYVLWSGVAVAVLGLGIRWWAMIVLGRFYTRTLTTITEQTVVNRGPYRFVRHPGYLGSMLTWIGAALACGNALVLTFVTAMLLVAYLVRIRAEERMLAENLGSYYQAYQKSSWRLLPFVF